MKRFSYVNKTRENGDEKNDKEYRMTIIHCVKYFVCIFSNWKCKKSNTMCVLPHE